jgi:hypothetical protein
MLDVTFIASLIRLTLLDSPFPHTGRAVPLLLGVCAQESGFTYNEQIGGGPALGFWQCEQATEADIWANFLAYQAPLRDCILTRSGETGANAAALQYNLVYQILLCRTHFYRCDPDPLPDACDLQEQAVRWKTYYNTPLGAGTEAEYIANYERLVRPYWPGPAPASPSIA